MLFLDGDDWLSADAVTRLAHALGRQPAAAASHGGFAFVPEIAHPGGRARQGQPQRQRQAPAHLSLSALISGNRFANGGHVLIRQDAWRAAGGFREDLRFAEDWEFWTRLRLQGPFTALAGASVLMVRRRMGSAMHDAATQPAAYDAALSAMAGNPALVLALGEAPLRRHIARARRELSWTIGREMLRRGMAKPALPLLIRGFFGQFRPQRGVILLRAIYVAWRNPA